MKSAPLNIYRMLLKKTHKNRGTSVCMCGGGVSRERFRNFWGLWNPSWELYTKCVYEKLIILFPHPIQWQCLSSVYRYKSTGLNTFVCCSAGQSPQTIPLCCRVCGGGSVYTHTCPPTVVGWSRYIHHEPQTVLRHSVHILKPTRHS